MTSWTKSRPPAGIVGWAVTALHAAYQEALRRTFPPRRTNTPRPTTRDRVPRPARICSPRARAETHTHTHTRCPPDTSRALCRGACSMQRLLYQQRWGPKGPHAGYSNLARSPARPLPILPTRYPPSISVASESQESKRHKANMCRYLSQRRSLSRPTNDVSLLHSAYAYLGIIEICNPTDIQD